MRPDICSLREKLIPLVDFLASREINYLDINLTHIHHIRSLFKKKERKEFESFLRDGFHEYFEYLESCNFVIQRCRQNWSDSFFETNRISIFERRRIPSSIFFDFSFGQKERMKGPAGKPAAARGKRYGILSRVGLKVRDFCARSQPRINRCVRVEGAPRYQTDCFCVPRIYLCWRLVTR